MKVCDRCGVEYQPITGEMHNGIHQPRIIRHVELYAVSLVSDPLPGFGIQYIERE